MLRFIFSFALLFCVGFFAGKTAPHFLPTSKPENEIPLLFSPSPYPLHNKMFVVVIIGRNNGAYVEKAISSVLSQNYDSFRLVYIDDASTDGSGSYARDAIFAHEKGYKAQFLQNSHSMGIARNLFQIIQNCFDEEIIVMLDETSRCSHEWVLQRLNQYYANPDLWMTCASALELPSFTPPEKSPLERLYLKTFYAGLWKKLTPEDVLEKGQFVIDLTDDSYILPCIQMTEGHRQFLPEILSLVQAKETL